MSLRLDDLSDEVILLIFQYLVGSDIRACQLVCRRFHGIVQSSSDLQFFIHGFVEFPQPRKDLTLKEKCNILRLHRERRKNRTVSNVNTFKIGVANGGFTSRWLPSITPLKDGVLAEWSLVREDSFMNLQLDVVQLPSLNTGTGFKQWRLEQNDLNIRGSAFEPAADLLVLLEYTGPYIDPFPRHLGLNRIDPNNIDPSGLGHGQPQPFLFHFRTLSTNEPHPNAYQSTLDCGLRTKSAWGFPLDCLGDLIITRPQKGHHKEWECGLIIYNWVTGTVLDQRDEVYRRDFVVLTKEVMVFPRSIFTYESRDKPMGRLDLYRINWSDPSGPSLTFVAILELPVVHSVPQPPAPPAGRTHVTLGAQGFIEIPAPQPDLSKLAITCSCAFYSSSHSGYRSAYTRGRPQVFTSPKYSQWLRVHITLPEPEFEFPIFGRDKAQPRSTSLYVPLHVIFDAIQSVHDGSSVKRVQWDDWGPQTRWIHLPTGFWEGYSPRAPASARAILTWHDAPKQHDAVGYFFNPDVKHDLDVWLLDFDPEFVKEVARQANGDRSENENVVGGELEGWVYQTATNNHMSPVAPYVDERQSWLGECGADKAVAPYAWCKLRHEYFDNVLAQIQHWKVYMDDEHSKLLIEAPRTCQTVKIVSFTF
ncbi:F-box protein [Ceratobasidium sp. AG-Ba]|nr:F-box protein [Ceratobasidium sp. AG-Ba]